MNGRVEPGRVERLTFIPATAGPSIGRGDSGRRAGMRKAVNATLRSNRISHFFRRHRAGAA